MSRDRDKIICYSDMSTMLHICMHGNCMALSYNENMAQPIGLISHFKHICRIQHRPTQNSEYLFAALIHHSILQRTTDTTCGPRATCGMDG